LRTPPPVHSPPLSRGRQNSLLTGNFLKKNREFRQADCSLFVLTMSEIGSATERVNPARKKFLREASVGTADAWRSPRYSVWPLHFWSQKLVSRVLRYFVPGAWV